MASTNYPLYSEDVRTFSFPEVCILGVETGSWATTTMNLLPMDDLELQTEMRKLSQEGSSSLAFVHSPLLFPPGL